MCGTGGWSVGSPWMVVSCMTGLMLMWPALRLGQNIGRAMSAEQVLWDWVCLILVVQVVIWPLRVSADWSMAQVVWLDVALSGWSLATGLLLLVCSGWTSGAGRTAGMAACLLLVLGEPLLMAGLAWAGVCGVWSMWVSPIDTLWALTSRPASIWPAHILGVTAAAVAGWVAATLGGSKSARAMDDSSKDDQTAGEGPRT